MFGIIEPMSDLEVIIHREETGGYWAEIPAMPGCFSDGATLAEVRRNIAEAAQCWLGMELRLALRRAKVQPSRKTEGAEAVLA